MPNKDHKRVSKHWGSEIWIENNNKYCGKLITVGKKMWSSFGKFHYHVEKDETFFVIEGELRLHILNKARDKMKPVVLEEGMSYRIKPGVLHRFCGGTDICKFIEFSTTHDDKDSYRIEVEEFNLDY